MQPSSGYRLSVYPTHVPCPLCIWPANPHVPIQSYCPLPAGICPESHLKFSVGSLMAVRSPPFEFTAKPVNVISQHFQPTYAGYETDERDRIRAPLISQAVENTQHRRPIAVKTRKRRKRTIFTTEQLRRLESEFAGQQYVVGNERQQLAKELNLSETQIKIWFQNRRIKWRKENMQDYPDLLSPLLSCGLPGICTREKQDGGNGLDHTIID